MKKFRVEASRQTVFFLFAYISYHFSLLIVLLQTRNFLMRHIYPEHTYGRIRLYIRSYTLTHTDV